MNMTLIHLLLRRLAYRPVTTGLNVLLVALGVAAMATVLLVTEQVENSFERNASPIDLVVGSKGSPLQMVLAGVYHLEAPTSPFPMEAAAAIASDPLVEMSVPIALGDSYAGFRIAGTQPSDFVALYGGSLEKGVLPTRSMDVVLGSEVARSMNAVVGDTFFGSHGLAEDGDLHGEAAYRVTGVLHRTGTVMDRLIVTPLSSIWDSHGLAEAAAGADGHEGEHGHAAMNPAAQEQGAEAGRSGVTGNISFLLLSYKSALAAATLPAKIKATGSLQAASPARETSKLLSLVQVGADSVRAVAFVLLVCAALSICAGLLGSWSERRRELAVMRLLGASRLQTAFAVTLEAALSAVIGVALGLVTAHVVLEFLGRMLPASALSLTGQTWLLAEAYVAGAATLAAVLGALVPALSAHRTPVADVLKSA